MGHGFAVQEKPTIRPEEVHTLKQGEFVGRTTDEKQPYFWARLHRHQFRRLHTIEPFVQFVRKADGNPVDDVNVILDRHFAKIKQEVRYHCYRIS